MVREKHYINEFLKTLYAKGSINKKVERKAHARWSKPRSCTYKIVKFPLPFITLHTTNDFTIKDLFHFSSVLDDKDHHLYMASLDVDSLSLPIYHLERLQSCQ